MQKKVAIKTESSQLLNVIIYNNIYLLFFQNNNILLILNLIKKDQIFLSKKNK